MTAYNNDIFLIIGITLGILLVVGVDWLIDYLEDRGGDYGEDGQGM